jgi:hypothetical protein
MNITIIVLCIIIALVLIIFPLIVSKRAESNSESSKSEWDKIAKYGNNINKKAKRKKLN